MNGPTRPRNRGTRPVRPLIVPLFLPHAGCPHRCAFCNQHAVTGKKAAIPSARAMADEVERALSRAGTNRFPVQISFYGGNFLGLESGCITRLLDAAERFVQAGRVHGIRFSTRPDTVDDRSIERLRPYTVSTVEIGAQSMDDRVLEAAGRGHDAKATVEAVDRLRQHGLSTGIQLMVGLPGESEASSLETARRIAALSPDFVRIYPTLVLEGSPMSRWYRQGQYRPLALEEAVFRTARLFRIFLANGIPVIRMGLHADQALTAPGVLLAGPHHPAFGHLVLSRHFLETAADRLRSLHRRTRSVCFRVHPRSESRMRGLHGANLEQLQARFDLASIRIVPDAAVGEYDLIATDSWGAGDEEAAGTQPA